MIIILVTLLLMIVVVLIVVNALGVLGAMSSLQVACTVMAGSDRIRQRSVKASSCIETS